MSDFRQLWFVKFFSHAPLTLKVLEAGLSIQARNEAERLIRWTEFTSAPVLRKGVLSSRIEFTINGQPQNVTWLPKGPGKKFRNELYRHLLKVHSGRAVNALSKIDVLVKKSGYLRTSHVSAIAHFAESQKKHLIEPPGDLDLPEEQAKPFVKLEQWAQAEPSLIEQLRNAFVTSEQSRFKALFDSVESNPLTDRQREACIIDEDNNLVLAGAGTGKTSTMIGRTAYLLQSGRARDSDILMLAFGRKAAEEMEERVAEKIPGAQVSAATFHSLGLKIIGDVEGARPQISKLAEDENTLAKTVDDWIKILLEERAYQKQVIRYFSDYLYPEKNDFDFTSQGEYFEYIRANKIYSLKGENVKSLEEALIANWLFQMGVEYQYEAPYQAAQTQTPDFRAYLPDFYLPEYDIYLEHFGIARDGSTAPYVDAGKYQEGIRWKRELHQEHETKLIETYSWERREGCLVSSLEKKLSDMGVTFDPLPDEAVLNTLRERGVITEFSRLMSQLIAAFKGNHETWEEVRTRSARLANPGQFLSAMELLKPIVDRYESHLKASDSIDFNDMIGRAINYVESGHFKPSWRYILVDEFQDISRPRARLVKALRDNTKNCSVFCVGDDWQAIYRFTGSDVTLTTGFQKEFGPTKTTSLDKTFRFNNRISEVASKFVMKNPAQVRKYLTTHSVVDEPAVSILRRGRSERAEGSELEEVFAAISGRVEGKVTVYLLARYWYRLPEKPVLQRLQRQFPKLNVERLTFHASKGKEADYVVILGLDVGPNGFPSAKETHPLLNALLPPEEPYEFAEERRLFYVALTRARHRAYLIADMSVASDFVKELIKEDYPVELEEFPTSLHQLHATELSCPVCKTGTMVPRTSGSTMFFGCSNYPLCTNTEPGCMSCGGAMKKQGDYKLCINEKCGSWVPLCSICGAPMRKRRGQYGEFWGCSNYRSTGPSCSNTMNHIPSPPRVH
ncbi:UvrD-helicase domain-containing protein [Marinobacter adhaerens]|jgi:DNA helicase-4|uniref:UvrD-helicase domain-containing protein n=1 Tax=Marinobacter adhaerens TaxID=1033846 RepID=UPI003BABF7BC